MKSKSSYHREQNTFKFKTFHDRLTDININVARTFGKFSAAPEDADTFFGEALDKWTDLNCTQHFVDFRKEISGEVQSLAQLVHHQDEVVAAIQKHLQIRNSLAVRPLLDLVVQLARDLQGDFYPCFEQFFLVIVWLLNTYHHDVEVLEQAFTCLAHLFKILWRLMTKDMCKVYSLFCPLLGDQHKDYINNFAAECFSFLLRKVKDRDEVFEFMLASLEESPDHEPGVARLLFEMVRGVQRQFHSSTEQILPVLLSKLGSKKLPHETVCQTLEDTWQSMARYTSPQHTGAIWLPLLTCIKEIHDECGKAKTKRVKEKERVPNLLKLKGLLRLVYVWTNYNNGVHVTPFVDKLVQVLACLLKGPLLNEDCAEVLLKVVTSLLLGDRCSMDIQHRPKLITLVFNTQYERHLLLDFARQLLDLPLFEKDLLPSLLLYSHGCMENADPATVSDILQTVTEILLHKVPLRTGLANPSGMNPYFMDFGKAFKSSSQPIPGFPSHALTELDKFNSGENLPADIDWGRLWALVFCLPHLRPLEEAACKKTLEELFPKLNKLALDKTLVENNDAALCTMAEVANSLCMLDDDIFSLVKAIDCDLVIQLLCVFPSNVHTLRLADLYFTCAKDGDPDPATPLFDEEKFSRIFPSLQDNLSSPYAQIRALTLHLLCQHDFVMPLLPTDVDIEQVGVFQICLDAEQIPADVHSYRDKLVQLRKLEYGVVQNQLPRMEEHDFKQVALRYLVGMLYTNFTLALDPIIELIGSHASGMDREPFWEVYSGCLNRAAQQAEKSLFREKYNPKKAKNLDVSQPPPEPDDLEGHFNDYKVKVANMADRPDHVNFRHLMWKAMAEFPEVCEPKSRVLSPLLFKFLDEEYYPEDLTAAPTQDIRKVKDDANNDSMDVGQSESSKPEGAGLDDSSAANQDAEPEVEEKDGRKKHRRAANKTLVVHLKVFSLFRSPMSMFMESRLKSLYFELLQHKDAAVQRVAFECIMTYNYSYLTPYRENFNRLLEDKSFKSEIVLFSIDESVTVIKPEHREELLPVLMRILYGKMQTKTGKDTSGRANSQIRKSIILRFLCGSQQNEIHIFLDLVFEPFRHFISENSVERVKTLIDDTDLSKVIPLRKQLGVLSTMDMVVKKLGNLIEGYLPKLLQILTCLTGQCSHLLTQRHLLSVSAVNMLKTVRNAALTRLNQFFETFDSYVFSTTEVDAVFTVAVWPQVEKLPKEGVYSPTPLLKMFNIWTQHIRYFPLLAKVDPERSEVTPLPYIFRLLHSATLHKSVSSMILEMVENLLTVEEEEEEEEEREKLVDAGATVVTDGSETGGSLGTRLLLPHVPALLGYLHKVVKAMSAQTGKRKVIPARELNILSRLSAYVTDPEQSGEVINLLLPFLGRKLTRTTDVEVDILTAVQHLIRQVADPQQFLPSLARLFSVLSPRVSRMALCAVVQAVAERAPDMSTLANLVSKLNAWDARRVEEPDYMVRLDGFEEAQRLLVATTDTNLLLMLVHNCVFFLATTEDMSLRDSSSFCMQALIKHLANLKDNRELFKVIVLNALMPEVKVGLKVKVEAARHEFINLLSHLVKHFPECPSFSDLVDLQDEEDLEKDFFANITHIQMHRRARAMRRFGHHLSKQRLRTDTLLSYALPIVTSFLRDDTYKKQTNVLDAAVETMGAICWVLPWPRYLLILKYYLELLPKSLEQQRLIVRIIVAVLDNFHYDLRHTKGVTFQKKPEEQVETEGGKPEDAEKDEDEGKLQEEADEDAMDTEAGKDEDTEADKDASAEGVTEEKTDEGSSTDGMESQALEVEPLSSRVICPEGLATRIHRVILKNIVPKLHQALTRKAKSDDSHRMAQAGKFAEDEEVLRVPIALAMVKLLQSLPAGVLQRNLPGVLLKVCGFLRSRSKDIRNSARDTLIKILQSLGAKYLRYILTELKSTLQRGYQLHVLAYTVWALLKNQVDKLGHGDLDSCMSLLVQIFNQELFGAVAEEKEVDGIVGKLFEARSSKSFDSYGILAKFITKDYLVKVVVPLKDVLATTHSQKITKKVAEVLRKVCQGLVENSGLELEASLTFIYGVTTEALPMMQAAKSKKDEKVVDPRLKPPSTYLLQRAPPRGGHKPRTQGQTNMYVIVEFGLQLLHKLLKHGRLVATEMNHLQMLDPFVEPLKDSLSSKHVKVTTSCLRCLLWVLKFPLPALKLHIEAISNSLFVLLNNYALAGAAKGDNFEMVVMGFKAVTVLVRDVDYHSISTTQLQVLLVYCEQDMHDFTRQATAFTLLKAILSRKLVVPEMEEVMHKVQQMSVNADSPHVRLQCRQVVLQYLLDYPVGKKLRNHLEFYISQLEYEYESGRESALEMMATMFSAFPQGLLVEYAGFFFVPLASALVNDESTKCRKLAALGIKSLLHKLDSSQRDKLFAMSVQWLQQPKFAMRKLAALSCGLFVEVETAGFERHLVTLLPIILAQIDPEKYDVDVSEGAEKELDHLLFSILGLLLKILRECNVLRKPKWTKQLNAFWDVLLKHLLYPHTWVRLVCAQLFGLLFGSWTPSLLVAPPSERQKKHRVEYLQVDLQSKLHSLCGAFCTQLTSPQLDTELAEQVVKNLVFLAKVLKLLAAQSSDNDINTQSDDVIMDSDDENTQSDDENAQAADEGAQGGEGGKKTSLKWLVTRMVRMARMEAALNVKETLKRTTVFKWLAAVSLDLGSERLPEFLPLMLPQLVREFTDTSTQSDAELKSLSQEVLDLIKATVGVEVFTKGYAAAQRGLVDRRQDRKRKKAMEAVANPELAARRKIRKQIKKKDAKKRKMEDFRPDRKVKRKMRDSHRGNS